MGEYAARSDKKSRGYHYCGSSNVYDVALYNLFKMMLKIAKLREESI